MQKQVFQTNSATRWKSFIWFSRILFVFLLVISASVAISLLNKRNYDLKVLTYHAKKLPDINTDKTKAYVSKWEEDAFAKHLKQFRAKRPKSFYYDNNSIPQEVKKLLPVRAGFYVNWDLNSLNSLQKNINQLNMVIPEWLFQTNTKGKVESRIEENTLEFLHKNKVRVLPILSNYYNNRWNGDSTFVLLKNPISRKALIDQIKTVLDTNELQGINIDFENLPVKAHPYMVQFSKELHSVLHEDGYLTTIDIDPETEGISYKNLAPYYDLIFLMAYNEHYPDGEPGSISSLPFLEKSLDEAMKEVPSQKIVLCIAGYGFDWPKDSVGTKISYQGMISLAKEYDEKVTYDLERSDISMYYTDDKNVNHEAHCNDAACNFNAIRTASDYGAGGVALWYLGSEDERIWDFYSKNLNIDYLNKNPFNLKQLEYISSILSVNYDGKGEILEMINEPYHGHTKFEYNKKDQLITNEEYQSLPSSYMLKRYGASNPKQIALTFDDGPNPDYTPKILDILKEKHVPATFFVIGLNIEDNIPLIKKIYDDGNEIGNHTFTHPNLEITSDNREIVELRSTRLLLESILGHSTLLFRPPYITDAEPKNLFQIKSLAVAHNEGFICVTSYIDPNDWEEGVTADTIVARAIAQQHAGNIILMHDAGGNRDQTIIALPRIIDYYKSQGFQFVTVSTLMGKTRDQVMPLVNKQFKFADTLDYIFFGITFLWQHFLHGFFIIAILLIILRLLTIAFLAILQNRKEKKLKAIPTTYQPKVSIIVPAYNEELNAERTVNHLLQSDYPDFDIIFVDDGSKDQTYSKILTAFENNPKVKVLTHPNGGKAAALNFGIEQATGEILVCIDADTMLRPDAISKMIPLFENDRVGAVAGNVKVGNKVNFLTNWQSIEYITSQNFDRRAYDYVNAILVVPGAIGAFRKKVIEEIEGFTTDTLAEDCDLTLRILRKGYAIKSSNEAMAFTEAPETVNMFLKQRFRWSFGMMQSFWKHRDLLFSYKQKNLGWVVLPNLLIFNFIIPIFSPIVDILFIAGLFTHNADIYAFLYLSYYLLDCLIASLAYYYDHETFNLKKALYLFVQRFAYRQLLFFVLLKAYLKAIKGEMALWGTLKRTGNVKN
ncbi:MAG: glycosyltransferase [Paludibacter sp.]